MIPIDEITDDKGGRMFVCSDTDYCEARQRPAIAAASAARTGEGAWLSCKTSPDDQPLLVAQHCKNYGRLTACRDVSLRSLRGSAGDRGRVRIG
jgi:hypothetical protein